MRTGFPLIQIAAVRGKQLWKVLLLITALITAAIGGAFIALAGMRSSEGVYTSALIPLAFLALVSFVFFIQRGLGSGPILILLAAYYLPFRISTGTESPIVDSLVVTCALAGIWMTRPVLLKEKGGIHPSPVNAPVIGFIAITVLSLGWSIVFRDPNIYVWDRFVLVQIASTLVMIMLPVAMLLAGNQITHVKQIEWMAALTIGAGVLGFAVDRLSLPLPVNTGGLVSMWITTISLSLILFHRKLKWIYRILLLLLCGWWIYRGFVLNLHWVAGWLPGFVAICVLSYMRSWRMLLIVILVLLVLIGPNQEYYLGTFIQQESEESLVTRQDAWKVNWEITKRHFLLGTGPAGYTVYYMSYFPSRAMATHNNFLDILAQTGIIGLGLLGWMFVVLLRIGIRLHRRLRRSGGIEESMANAALAGLAGAIVIMMFGDWMFPFAYTQTIAGYDYIVPSWLFLGSILALDRMTEEPPV
jgi:O-antigen ligase